MTDNAEQAKVERIAELIREHTDADTNDATFAAYQIAALPSGDEGRLRDAAKRVVDRARSGLTIDAVLIDELRAALGVEGV